jgi:hypothetical protein
MRTTIGLAILLTSGILGIVGASGRKAVPTANPQAPSVRAPLIVHEWGTFTNFSGSDGIQLEFRPLVDAELPAFVYNRSQLLFHPLFNPFIKRELVARQRMETPVTYFYSDRPRTLDVRVDFPRGLLTEFYPPAGKMTPPFTANEGPLRDSSLTWQIKVHPPAEFAKTNGQIDGPPALPEVNGDDHYGFARETDSAVVEVTDHFGQMHAEKFLFYRGVGNFTLPLRLEAFSSRRFQAVNDSPHAIESLFMVMIDDDGLHFCQYPELMAHATLTIQVPDAVATPDELGERMAEALVTAGLYEKEARAMVHTWHSSWFDEPGARLFYTVPRSLTDEIIPLTVAPAPDKMVRVLVGRMETLTPEAADRLSTVINELGTCLAPDAEPLRSELDRLGRFALPALAYLATDAGDPATRDAVRRLRAELKDHARQGSNL